MSIADKLVTIAENQEKVFNAGYEKGKQESTDNHYDEFWDVYQTNGTANNYAYVFAGRGWNSNTYHPKYPLDTGAITNCAAMYLWSGVSEIGSVNFENATSFNIIFQGCQLLTTIEGIKFPPADIPNGVFDFCYKLKNITVLNTIVGNINFKDSPLTKASILSVFNALSTSATGKTATFKKTAVDAAFETSTGANDGSTSSEWLAMVDRDTGEKRNWTIALV